MNEYQGRGPHHILEGLCCRKCWRCGGLDLQLLARARVAPRAALSGASLERPEALQADLLSLCGRRSMRLAAIEDAGVSQVRSSQVKPSQAKCCLSHDTQQKQPISTCISVS